MGWVRANTVTNPELFQELNEQRKENQELKEKINIINENNKISNIDDLADLNDKFTINGNNTYGGSKSYWSVNLTWKEIFFILSPHLIQKPSDSNVKAYLSHEFFVLSKSDGYSPYINEQIFQSIKIHLTLLGLVKVEYTKTTDGGGAVFWFITAKGSKLMMEIRAVRK